jgi:hypothetical protein
VRCEADGSHSIQRDGDLSDTADVSRDRWSSYGQPEADLSFATDQAGARVVSGRTPAIRRPPYSYFLDGTRRHQRRATQVRARSRSRAGELAGRHRRHLCEHATVDWHGSARRRTCDGNPARCTSDAADSTPGRPVVGIERVAATSAVRRHPVSMCSGSQRRARRQRDLGMDERRGRVEPGSAQPRRPASATPPDRGARTRAATGSTSTTKRRKRSAPITPAKPTLWYFSGHASDFLGQHRGAQAEERDVAERHRHARLNHADRRGPDHPRGRAAAPLVVSNPSAASDPSIARPGAIGVSG